jgi:RNA polymerase sigma factor (sigma-70 family)
MSLEYDEIMPLIKKVAASTSRSFPGYIDVADVEGELLLFLYKKKTWVENTIESSPGQWKSKLAPLMRKQAYDYCNKEKAATEGYDPADVYRYSIPKIQTLIVDVFDYEDWQSFGNRSDGQPKARAQANTTGDRIVELIDIRTALLKLTDDGYNALVYQYKYGYSMAEIAEAQDVSLETAKKRCQRALKALQKALGYKDPEDMRRRPERRTVRSNAAWTSDQSHQYEG